jgi:molybdopterin-guanine dinucleotide biosynthesis protein A
MTSYDAVVLAGGGARRLGGLDKPAQEVGGASLLDRVLAATADAQRTVVVGPERVTARQVLWTAEEPAGGGPVAALVAGLALVTAAWVVLLAADLPFVVAGTVYALLDALVSSDGAGPAGSDGALLVDDSGRDQLLVGVWRTAALRAALPDVVNGARLGLVLGGLDAVRVSVPTVAGKPAPWTDCDTDEDLRRAREIA